MALQSAIAFEFAASVIMNYSWCPGILRDAELRRHCDVNCPHSLTRVMIKLGKTARGHFVALIKIDMHLITCTFGRIWLLQQMNTIESANRTEKRIIAEGANAGKWCFWREISEPINDHSGPRETRAAPEIAIDTRLKTAYRNKKKQDHSPTLVSECSNASFQTLSIKSELYLGSREAMYLANGWLSVNLI